MKTDQLKSKDIIDGELYFIGRNIVEMGLCNYSARGKNGKAMMSVKRGIAIHYNGSDEVRKFLDDNPDHFAEKIPANADKKWRAR